MALQVTVIPIHGLVSPFCDEGRAADICGRTH